VLLLQQAELAPDIDEEINCTVTDVLRERKKNAVSATTIEVIDEDGKAEPNQSRSRHQMILMLALVIIGMVTTFSLVLSRKRSSLTDHPTMI
jgi:hypothetical protein